MQECYNLSLYPSTDHIRSLFLNNKERKKKRLHTNWQSLEPVACSVVDVLRTQGFLDPECFTHLILDSKCVHNSPRLWA